MSEAPAVGIDLGTTYSCISYFQNNVANIVPNENGRRTTASFVSFTDEGRIIGDDAKNRTVLDPANTIFGTV